MPIYFAQFLPSKDGHGAYAVDFPDLPGCFTEGDSLPEALDNARECLTGYLKACKKRNEDIPAPSSAAEAQKKPRLIVEIWKLIFQKAPFIRLCRRMFWMKSLFRYPFPCCRLL